MGFDPSWPGRLIAEKIKTVELDCGVKFRIVSSRDHYQVLLVLGRLHSDDGTIIGEKENRARVVAEVQQILGADAPMINGIPVVDTPNPTYVIAGNYSQARPLLMPYPYDRYILGDWDDRIRQLANVFSSDSEYTHLKQELFRALDTLEGFCPREIADHFLRQAHIDETPDVIMHLLYDHRIKAGMTMSSFEETAAKILRESIRSK